MSAKTYRACKLRVVALACRCSAFAFVARARDPCIVCSKILIAVSNTWRCMLRVLYAVFASSIFSAASKAGRSTSAAS